MCETLIDVGLKSILHARKDQPASVTSRRRRKYMVFRVLISPVLLRMGHYDILNFSLCKYDFNTGAIYNFCIHNVKLILRCKETIVRTI